MSDLDSEFKDFENAVKENGDKIKALVAKAESLLDEAAKLSEETGVPFQFDFYGVRAYIPKSMMSKFEFEFELSDNRIQDLYDVIWELTGASYVSYDNEPGWQYSTYC